MRAQYLAEVLVGFDDMMVILRLNHDGAVVGPIARDKLEGQQDILAWLQDIEVINFGIDGPGNFAEKINAYVGHPVLLAQYFPDVTLFSLLHLFGVGLSFSVFFNHN